ncbi:hypothetical protein TNCV_4851371 [Trichonephila clavipes]|nr:hypothetical protein TNCV_4851371 [Trichonephila clavipes]
MLEEVIGNWTSRLDYIRASRGSTMPEIIFRIWFKEPCRCCNSLQDEEHTGRLSSAVITDNMSTIRKMLADDNRCIY